MTATAIESETDGIVMAHPDDEETAPLPPEETSGGKQVTPTLKVDGRDVSIVELAACYDPNCRDCSRGMLIRVIPNPVRGPNEPRMVRAAELCRCAIRRWRKANPADPVLYKDQAEAAIASMASDEAVKPDSRRKHVERMRAELTKNREALAEIETAESGKVAPLAAALVEAQTAETRALALTFEWRDRLAEVDAQILEYETAIAALRSRRKEHEEALARCADGEALAAAGVTEAREKFEAASSVRRPERRTFERKIEQVEKRLARIVERHPELAEGAAEATAA